MGLGMCKVVVEFATVNRNLLLQGGEEGGGGGVGEGEGQDPAQLQSQEEALEVMQLVLVRERKGRRGEEIETLNNTVVAKVSMPVSEMYLCWNSE